VQPLVGHQKLRLVVDQHDGRVHAQRLERPRVLQLARASSA
jgi:hypothetical protein